jgi:hypothetical protein
MDSSLTSAVVRHIAADDLTGREALNATLWMQVAPEYRANVQQVYRMASERIAAPLRAVRRWNRPA